MISMASAELCVVSADDSEAGAGVASIEPEICSKVWVDSPACVFCSASGDLGVLEHADVMITMLVKSAGSPIRALIALISKADSPYLSVVFKSLADKLELMK